MLASKSFSIVRSRQDDWFDPILDADTKLFVDPFLVFTESDAYWQGAHDDIIRHFDHAFQLIAEGNRNSHSTQYKKALHLLVFTEPKELCLGYTDRGTSGLGSGRGYAITIASAICDAIGRGLIHPRHFEELGILNEGIGADRISDITCTILKSRLISYTQDIAATHGIDTAPHRIFASGFDGQRLRWQTLLVNVPTNPCTQGPLLFVPHRFLRQLPVLNADDWWESFENEQLREDMNYEIMGRVNKATIVAKARANPESVRQWTINKEAETPPPYDLARDPQGVHSWDKATDQYTERYPLTIAHADSEESFGNVIQLIVNQFKHFIEEQGGWYLLWATRNQEKPESAAQLLFRGIAQNYCRANNISLDAEVNLGRGPVDFKFSTGYERRVHLEVKKLHNGKFWNGLEQQLPSYMCSDQVSEGWFLVIRYRDGRRWDGRVRELPERVANIGQRRQINLHSLVVDARPAASASSL